MKRAALSAIAIFLGARLLIGPLRQSWSQMSTDFPNHYVGAILTQQRLPLRQFYDWEWFQRQIQYTGIDRQLGGYTPYPPLTAAPFLPLAKLPPQKAKQVWLVLELVFLAGSVWLLAQCAELGILNVLVLALLAYTSIATNLLLGQYYIFLLLLLCGAIFARTRGHEFTSGALLGMIFSLKLYAAPFALYFLVRRQWRALAGMVTAVAVLALAATAWFGWDGVRFYATSVMTRGVDGSIVDPYNPGLGSMAVLLRRIFIPEPELNPHPLWNAPWAFFFLQTFYTLAVLALALLAVRRQPDARAGAFFILVLFAISPVTAYSHFVLLLAPVVMLLAGASPRRAAAMVALYVLAQLPTRPWDAWLFPKLWCTLALTLYAGWQFRSELRLRPVMVGLTIAAGISAVAAGLRWNTYRTEPPQIAELVAPRPGALFSSAPAVSHSGVIYESMERDFFNLRSGELSWPMDGEAFHPSVPLSGSPVYFELVSHGQSQIAKLDPELSIVARGAIEPAISPDGQALAYIAGGSLYLNGNLLVQGDVSDPAFFPDGRRIVFAQGFPGRRSIRAAGADGGVTTLVEGGDNLQPAVSPDGRFLAYVHAQQVWLRDLKSGAGRRLTSGACNNTWPAWDSDSRSVVFASDCSRGYGLPALYRMQVAPTSYPPKP